MWKWMIAVFIRISMLLALGFALFAQHIVCFNIYSTNNWYLYFIAIGCAAIQYLILFTKQIRESRKLLQIGFYVYLLGISWSILLLLLMHTQEQIGLGATCAALDSLGAYTTYALGKKLSVNTESKKTEGSLTIISVCLITAVIVLLFVQHLAIFDVFSTNAWYLYVITIACAAAQYFILFANPIRHSIKSLQLCCWVYLLSTSWSVFFLLLLDSFGLVITCTVSDIVGIYITYALRKQNGIYRDK